MPPRRALTALLLTLSLIPLACGPNAPEEPTANQEVQNQHEPGDSQNQPEPGDNQNQPEPGDNQNQPEPGDNQNQPEPLPTIEPAVPALWIETDTTWTTHDLLGGSAQLTCTYRDGHGRLLEQPDDLELIVTGHTDINEDGRYLFSEAGAYSVSCSSATLELSTEDELIVAFEGIHHLWVEAMARIGQMEPLWLALSAELDTATDDLNLDAIEAILDALLALSEGLSDDLEDLPLLIEHPVAWPTLEELADYDLEAGPDDHAYLETLESLIARQIAFRESLLTMSLDMHTHDLDTLAIPLTHLHQELAIFREIQPSELAFWEHQDLLAELLFQTARTAELHVQVLYSLGTEDPLTLPNASLMGQLGVAAIKVAWDRFGFTPWGWYKGTLVDVGRVAAISALNMAAAGIFNRLINPVDGAPHISGIHGSAGGFVCSGIPFTAVGAFHPDPARTVFFFLPPSSLFPIFEIYDIITQLSSLASSLATAVQSLTIVSEILFYNELEKSVSKIRGFSGPGEFIVELSPNDGDGDFLYFGPLPPGMNDSFLPAAGTFFPMDRRYGFGEAINVNVVQGECG